jgi:hypothetical protein
VVAGFVAFGVSALALVVASGLAGALGAAFKGSGLVWDWLYNLTNNPVTSDQQANLFKSLGLHLFFSMAWAVFYALLFEPRLRSYSGWKSGVIFAMLPFFLSVVVFFPLTGAGLFGSALNAGPLPLLGNLLLHLIYGATLGAGYAARTTDFVSGLPAGPEPLSRPERSAAGGIFVGLVAGAIVGVVAGAAIPHAELERMVGGSWFVAMAVAGALVGAAIGALLGSMLGLYETEAGPARQWELGQPVSAALIPIGVLAFEAVVIVTIGTLLLTVSPASALEHHDARAYYNPAILVGLLILLTVTVVATWIDRTGPTDRGH